MTYTITKIVASQDYNDPANTRGKAFADAVNGLVDLVDGLADRNGAPAVNPDVVTHPNYDPARAYSIGDEVRTSYGYFRCIADVAVGEYRPLSDLNHWLPFYLPQFPNFPFAGLYNKGATYGQKVLLVEMRGTEMHILQSRVPILSDSSMNDVHFKAIDSINLG